MYQCSECGKPHIAELQAINPNNNYMYPPVMLDEVLKAYQNTGDPVDSHCYCFECNRFVVRRTVLLIAPDSTNPRPHDNRPTEMILRNQIDT